MKIFFGKQENIQSQSSCLSVVPSSLAAGGLSLVAGPGRARVLGPARGLACVRGPAPDTAHTWRGRDTCSAHSRGQGPHAGCCVSHDHTAAWDKVHFQIVLMDPKLFLVSVQASKCRGVSGQQCPDCEIVRCY